MLGTVLILDRSFKSRLRQHVGVHNGSHFVGLLVIRHETFQVLANKLIPPPFTCAFRILHVRETIRFSV